jgi:transcription initiation factor IIF auxiliary subunit
MSTVHFDGLSTRLLTQLFCSEGRPQVVEGFPMKEWTIEIYILDEEGKEHPATAFVKAVYHLHPSFDNPVQSRWCP